MKSEAKRPHDPSTAAKERFARLTPEERRSQTAGARRANYRRRVMRSLEAARQLVVVELGGSIAVTNLDAAVEHYVDRLAAARDAEGHQ